MLINSKLSPLDPRKFWELNTLYYIYILELPRKLLGCYSCDLCEVPLSSDQILKLIYMRVLSQQTFCWEYKFLGHQDVSGTGVCKHPKVVNRTFGYLHFLEKEPVAFLKIFQVIWKQEKNRKITKSTGFWSMCIFWREDFSFLDISQVVWKEEKKKERKIIK